MVRAYVFSIFCVVGIAVTVTWASDHPTNAPTGSSPHSVTIPLGKRNSAHTPYVQIEIRDPKSPIVYYETRFKLRSNKSDLDAINAGIEKYRKSNRSSDMFEPLKRFQVGPTWNGPWDTTLMSDHSATLWICNKQAEKEAKIKGVDLGHKSIVKLRNKCLDRKRKVDQYKQVDLIYSQLQYQDALNGLYARWLDIRNKQGKCDHGIATEYLGYYKNYIANEKKYSSDRIDEIRGLDIDRTLQLSGILTCDAPGLMDYLESKNHMPIGKGEKTLFSDVLDLIMTENDPFDFYKSTMTKMMMQLFFKRVGQCSDQCSADSMARSFPGMSFKGASNGKYIGVLMYHMQRGFYNRSRDRQDAETQEEWLKLAFRATMVDFGFKTTEILSGAGSIPVAALALEATKIWTQTQLKHIAEDKVAQITQDARSERTEHIDSMLKLLKGMASVAGQEIYQKNSSYYESEDVTPQDLSNWIMGDVAAWLFDPNI